MINFTSRPFYSRGNVPILPLVKRFGGLSFSLHSLEKRQVVCPCRKSKLCSLVVADYERTSGIIIIIIIIIIGATGIVTRSLKNNLQAIPGAHLTDSLQKTAILGTSHILRKALQCET